MIMSSRDRTKLAEPSKIAATSFTCPQDREDCSTHHGNVLLGIPAVSRALKGSIRQPHALPPPVRPRDLERVGVLQQLTVSEQEEG